jgi:hypothetical protein
MMSALDSFAAAMSALDRALDGHDPDAIMRANEIFLAAIFEVRAVGAWRAQPALAREAADMLGRVELAQQRVKNLTRDTRERLLALDAARAAPALSLYGPGGEAVR